MSSVTDAELLTYLGTIKTLAAFKREMDIVVKDEKVTGRPKLFLMSGEELGAKLNVPASRLYSIIRKVELSFIFKKRGTSGGYCLAPAPRELREKAIKIREENDKIRDPRKWTRTVDLTYADIVHDAVLVVRVEQARPVSLRPLRHWPKNL